MIKFNFVPARDELNIVLENIHDPEFSDVNFLVNNIGYYQNIINNLKDFNLNNEINNLVTIKNNSLMSLEFVDNVINNQLNDCMQFIDISDLALMFFKQCQVDSKQLDSLLNNFINLGISIETFDNNDLSQVMLKFYVVYEIYKRSIIKHKHYTTISDFYNCLNEDIIDYCVS